ncbi:MAG: hypothetical protein A3I11_09285 [Elusimicrobia bacterium RIFCSPLOWO2_02_FULL_39_32]|nr:MAG: hypothetical protein A2034_01215 [Elusimicrobia bacterium GWA2_38_7]OGR79929.1 MAG: hypothetical protein A3B80_01355 [Elusimicrobia bacterium RIFCSPHIGHO2_02_FULL_39_36]OGR93464.1 MAG: hypothetical protein A3I11_09285 [Elusimicrobia bacterium RIFCSPLOWO2_02_FULL_39_32]OGS00311.1 MAG: hypothetical protein A3G85_05725 [Elusimicrobia bacterium RIFCSPLOWO2_12_FULL_39_28]
MSKIPKFKSDKEIREFWNKHSLSDYEEDLKPAPLSFHKPRKEVVTLRLDRSVVTKLKTMAKKIGIGYSSLARMWVMEKIEKELPHTSLQHH